MKAFVYDRSNGPKNLIFREVDKPLLKEDEYLVKIEGKGENFECVLVLEGPLFSEALII